MATFTIPEKSAVTSISATTDVFPVWQGGAQKKATAAQIVASVPMVGDNGSGGAAGVVPAPATGDAAARKYLKADGTWAPVAGYISTAHDYIVAPSGGDFTDIQSAISSLDGYILRPSAKQTILVSDGVYTINSPVLKEGPFGQNTWIQGANTYTKNVMSIASSSGSSGFWSIVLNIDSVSNILVNDYIAIMSPSGGSLPTYLAGCHKVTNVGASTITITSTHRHAIPPSGAVTAAVTVLKTVLYFPNTDGFRIWTGASVLNFQDVVIVGGGANVGISLQDGGGRCFINGVVGVVGFETCVYANYNTELNGDGALIISSAAGDGVAAVTGATVESTTTIISGCGKHGINAFGGSIRSLNGIVTGNGASGIASLIGGIAYVDTMSSTGNATWGYEYDGMSALYVTTSTASTNRRGSYSPRVEVDPTQNYTLLSNFSYGFNGAVTPNGGNIFVGGAGNNTTGSTATVATQSSENTGAGLYALASITTGNDNTAMGVSSLSHVTTGSENVGVGHGGGQNITSGQYNTGIGSYAIGNITSGTGNIGIGLQAGWFITGGSAGNRTSTYSIYVGYNCKAKADGGANEIVIGYNTIGAGSNTTTIGNSSTTLTQLYGVIQSTTYTVATLPGASTSGVGARAFVTDANTTMAVGIGATVAGGGSNAVPVYSDGTNWKIG